MLVKASDCSLRKFFVNLQENLLENAMKNAFLVTLGMILLLGGCGEQSENKNLENGKTVEPVKDAKYYAANAEELKALLDICEEKIEAVKKMEEFEPLKGDTECQTASFAEAVVKLGNYDKAVVEASPEEFWKRKMSDRRFTVARWEAVKSDMEMFSKPADNPNKTSK